jgi:dihydrofolate synthase/folylpolyglutamate synthase
MIMNELEAFAYLKNALTFGIRLGLERMNQLMSLLGSPERSLRCIHIAGTNGKGSVTAYCSAILAAAGLRVGIYTSPYLERFSERIRILNGLDDLLFLQSDETTGEITMTDFLPLLTKVKNAANQMVAGGADHPTEFELVTAVAFLYYQQRGVDIVVLETGLGGRLDSTNIIEHPLAVIITAISYDHMDRLGSTITEITTEKAGIIKTNTPVFLYDPDMACPDQADAVAVYSVVRARCQELRAPLAVILRQQVETRSLTIEGQRFFIKGFEPPFEQDFTTLLLGHYQPMNATMAIAACRSLNPVFQISDAAIHQGIALAHWPARLELVRNTPPVLIDGAHNRQGAEALAESLKQLFPMRRLILICGVLQDKEYVEMLRIVLAFAGDRLKQFFCVTPDNPRALPAAKLAATAGNIFQELIHSGIRLYNDTDTLQAFDQPEQALQTALALAEPDVDLICVFGSLYLAGKMRRLVLAENTEKAL